MTYPHESMEVYADSGQSMADMLAQYDEQFGGVAPAEQKDFEPLPAGSYQAKIDRAEVKKAKTSGRPMLEITWQIIGPTHAGRLVWQRHILDRPDGWPYLKADMAMMGVIVETLSSVPEACEKLLDRTAEIFVKHSGEYTNVYINKRLDLGAEPEPEGDALPF